MAKVRLSGFEIGNPAYLLFNPSSPDTTPPPDPVDGKLRRELGALPAELTFPSVLRARGIFDPAARVLTVDKTMSVSDKAALEAYRVWLVN